MAKRIAWLAVLAIACGPLGQAARWPRKAAPKESAIDQMIREAGPLADPPSKPSPGSLFGPAARFADPYRELRASQVNDIVTIVVADRASAVQRGTSNTQRKSSANASIGSIAGKQIGPLVDLASISGDQKLQGQGVTTRESSLSTTLTARVTHVLPNGNLVLEAQKEIAVNQEVQTIRVRGVIRPFDVSAANSVRSDRLANLELLIAGKGIVADAVRRPNLLYRILLGVLPF